MKPKELLRLVWINITQNKFKVIMTSIGIIVGAATIVMVIAIGKGGQADVADQFKNLNAGAVDISYDGGTDFGGGGSSDDSDSGMAMMAPGGSSGGGFGGGFGGAPSGDMGGGSSSGGEAPGGSPGGEMPSGDGDGMPNMGSFFGGQSDMEERMNQENITLSEDDVDDIETFASGISAATISYTTKSSVDGGDLDEADTYTIAGVKSNYETISNLSLAVGSFITDDDDENKEKVCVLGASVAEEIFGSAIEAYGSVIYIDDRLYVVNGVLECMGTVASGISPDDSIFIPYATGVKYLVGSSVSPTITVLAADVNNVEGVIEEVTAVLATSYPNAEFTFEDAGSKMEAAEASNQILTMLLIAMAAIVFVVGQAPYFTVTVDQLAKEFDVTVKDNHDRKKKVTSILNGINKKLERTKFQYQYIKGKGEKWPYTVQFFFDQETLEYFDEKIKAILTSQYHDALKSCFLLNKKGIPVSRHYQYKDFFKLGTGEYYHEFTAWLYSEEDKEIKENIYRDIYIKVVGIRPEDLAVNLNP